MDAEAVGTGMAVCTTSTRARHGFEVDASFLRIGPVRLVFG